MLSAVFGSIGTDAVDGIIVGGNSSHWSHPQFLARLKLICLLIFRFFLKKCSCSFENQKLSFFIEVKSKVGTLMRHLKEKLAPRGKIPNLQGKCRTSCASAALREWLQQEELVHNLRFTNSHYILHSSPVIPYQIRMIEYGRT